MIRKGDKFTVEFTADADQRGNIATIVGSVKGTAGVVFYVDQVKSHTPAPWTPQKGDIVFTRDRCQPQGVEVQAIYGDYILLWWRDHSGAPWVRSLSSVYKDRELTICAD